MSECCFEPVAVFGHSATGAYRSLNSGTPKYQNKPQRIIGGKQRDMITRLAEQK